VGRAHDALDQALHARVALVEDVRQERGIAVHAQGELGEVVRADREPVEELRELRREHDVVRDLAHDPDLEAVAPAHETVPLHLREHGGALAERATEGHHHAQVGEPHRLAHAPHGPTLEREAVAVVLVVVARRAAEPDHRIALGGLEPLSAGEARVLAGLEVGEAREHRARVERRRDHGHA